MQQIQKDSILLPLKEGISDAEIIKPKKVLKTRLTAKHVWTDG